ncbi:AbrB/MazE/SpoVT family DNA-binding domain-containing protein [Candidatus Micrarchaeota archaeon]|nr:AbrB/MazE/SpoVT family DNA-binding domain-containing protein [Candidatus Micrarchaeota archaeon]
MRLFKHGDALAVVIPRAVCDKLQLAASAELEFFEVEKGVFVVATRDAIGEKLKPVVQPVLKQAAPRLMVFPTEQAARDASKRFEKQLRVGELIGVCADKKYYFVSGVFYNSAFQKLSSLLSTEKTLGELSKQSGLPLSELVPVIGIMKDKGEIIEKKKGTFLLVK